LKIFFKIFIRSAFSALKVVSFNHDRAASQLIGVLMMVILVILLAAVLMLMIQFPSFDLQKIRTETPSFIEIRRFYHENEHGALNYDSRVILYHNGTENLENSKLWAEFYRNGGKLPVIIETLNGYEFVSTHHQGVQTIGGLGCSGPSWSPGEKILIDFSDGTFHPGDQVRVDIFVRPSGALISQYTRTA
jgi:hypothetical protein